MRPEAVAALQELNEVIEKLRAPGGCPWDAAQTHASLRPYLLEETYEALEAIDAGDSAALQEELGDVLLQVLMHSAIAMEAEDGFDIGDVAQTTKNKMIHRHPHVFGDTEVGGAADVVVNWERLKNAEANRHHSLLAGIPATLPALAYAQDVQKRPARLGWDEIASVQDALQHLQDATSRLASAAGRAPGAVIRGRDWSISEGEIRSATSRLPAAEREGEAAAVAEAEDALAEVLWIAVALARHLRLNPEDALRMRTADFVRRFQRLEALAAERGMDLHSLGPEQWPALWRETEDPLRS